jgi:hypothetical protein
LLARLNITLIDDDVRLPPLLVGCKHASTYLVLASCIVFHLLHSCPAMYLVLKSDIVAKLSMFYYSIQTILYFLFIFPESIMFITQLNYVNNTGGNMCTNTLDYNLTNNGKQKQIHTYPMYGIRKHTSFVTWIFVYCSQEGGRPPT